MSGPAKAMTDTQLVRECRRRGLEVRPETRFGPECERCTCDDKQKSCRCPVHE